MLFSKTSCADCAYCSQCPMKTRMYVNYCGSDARKVMDRIRSARADCSNRKGHTLTWRIGAVPAGMTAGAAMAT